MDYSQLLQESMPDPKIATHDFGRYRFRIAVAVVHCLKQSISGTSTGAEIHFGFRYASIKPSCVSRWKGDHVNQLTSSKTKTSVKVIFVMRPATLLLRRETCHMCYSPWPNGIPKTLRDGWYHRNWHTPKETSRSSMCHLKTNFRWHVSETLGNPLLRLHLCSDREVNQVSTPYVVPRSIILFPD
jgi:hypothetical protein